jgi:hypothetical protein
MLNFVNYGTISTNFFCESIIQGKTSLVAAANATALIGAVVVRNGLPELLGRCEKDPHTGARILCVDLTFKLSSFGKRPDRDRSLRPTSSRWHIQEGVGNNFAETKSFFNQKYITLMTAHIIFEFSPEVEIL